MIANSDKAVSPWHVLAATWLGAFFDGLDATIYVMVLVPALTELLKTTSHTEMGVVGSYILAIFMVGWAVGAAVFGMLADHIGRARTLTITILLYAICTGLCATANTWQELAFYRFLVGCGIGGEIGIGGVLLAEAWKGRARLHAAAAMVSAFGVGYLATSALNLCLGGFGWRWLFVAGVVPALLTVYLRIKLKDSTEFEFLAQRKARAKQKPVHARTQEEKALLEPTFPSLFKKKTLPKTIIIATMASSAIMGYWAVLAWIPAWVNQLVGTAAVQERSITVIAMNLGLVVSAMIGGWYVRVLGRSVAFRIGSLASFICCVAMFLTVKSFGPALLAWAFITGFVTVMPFVVLFIYVPELFETRIRGTGFGFSYNLGRIFAAIAALCGGQLIAMFGGSYAHAGATVAGVYLIGVAASFFMPVTKGEVELESELAPIGSVAIPQPIPALSQGVPQPALAAIRLTIDAPQHKIGSNK